MTTINHFSRFVFILSLLVASACANQMIAQDSPTVAGNMASLIVPGQTFSRTAEGETGITFHVYVPENYKASEPAPLLIAFSPAGDGKGILEKLKDGIEEAGWVLVGCDRLRNRLNDHELEIKMEDEILNDVLTNLPHDPTRVYLGGFSGGAMRAYGITARRQESYAGILAYGGWLGGPEYSDEPYQEGLSVAMINGIDDTGANGPRRTPTAVGLCRAAERNDRRRT